MNGQLILMITFGIVYLGTHWILQYNRWFNKTVFALYLAIKPIKKNAIPSITQHELLNM